MPGLPEKYLIVQIDQDLISTAYNLNKTQKRQLGYCLNSFIAVQKNRLGDFVMLDTLERSPDQVAERLSRFLQENGLV